MTDDRLALFDVDAPAPRRPLEPAPTGALPPHVRAHLDALGALNHDGIGKAVQSRRCVTCRVEVLVGLDGPIAARTVIADAIEVDEIGEALAIACRRARWWIGSFPDSKKRATWQFVPRWLEDIGKPFRGPVFIEHRCNAPPPPARQSRFVHPTRKRTYLDIPDF